MLFDKVFNLTCSRTRYIFQYVLFLEKIERPANSKLKRIGLDGRAINVKYVFYIEMNENSFYILLMNIYKSILFKIL